MFPGDSGVDQLVEIIKVLGTPTKDQIEKMNPNYTTFKFPQIKACPWAKVLPPRTPEPAFDLCDQLLKSVPGDRINPYLVMAHPFFDDLRKKGTALDESGRTLPPLYNFTEDELKGMDELSVREKILPEWLA